MRSDYQYVEEVIKRIELLDKTQIARLEKACEAEIHFRLFEKKESW